MKKWIPPKCMNMLYRRARSIQRGEDARRLACELGLEAVPRGDLELIQTLLSVRSIMRARPSVLVDVGAHRGDFSKYAAKIFAFRRVECFEADHDLIGPLRHSLYGLNAVVHQVAISNRNGNGGFYVHESRGMSSLLAVDLGVLASKFPADNGSRILYREVPLATLDSFCAADDELRTDRFFLKVDTQGNEMDVLEGARETLQRTDGCLIEYMFCTPYKTSHTFEQLVQFMSASDFYCSGAVEIKRRPNGEVSGVDFLFLRKAQPE